MEQLAVQASLIGLIPHRQIHPGLIVQNGFGMAEGIKAGLAVVRTHTAFANTAEAHIGCGKVDHTIVDTAAAIPAPLRHITDDLFVLSKDIQCQRPGPVR